MSQSRSFLPAARFAALTPYFDFLAGVTVREREFKRRFLDFVKLERGDRVLDLGAGTGTLAIALKERCPDVSVVGLDPDGAILAIARRKAEQAGAEVRWVEGFADAMPFDDGSFDVVVSTLVFHHLPGAVKRGAAAEIARVLRPGGSLYVGDFGKPKDPLQELGFLFTRTFDGWAPTSDNRRGALPRIFTEAGLADARAHADMRTPLGTLAFYSARA